MLIESEPSLGRLIEQDPDAWEQVYRRAYPRLIAYARRRLATRDQAEDAVSETMVRAINSIDRYAPGVAGVDGWLFGIVRFVVLEIYRTRTVATETFEEHAAPEAGPLERVVQSDEQLAMRRAFESLDATDQELLTLRVVAGLDAEAVGELLGKQPGAVRTAQSRALGRLRGKLQEVGG